MQTEREVLETTRLTWNSRPSCTIQRLEIMHIAWRDDVELSVREEVWHGKLKGQGQTRMMNIDVERETERERCIWRADC